MNRTFSQIARKAAPTLAMVAAMMSPSGLCAAAAEAPPVAAQQDRFATISPHNPYLTALVYSTLVSLNDANQTNDYTVFIKRLATPYQVRANQAAMSEIFRPFRDGGIDLAPAVLHSPDWSTPPVVRDGVLRLAGRLHSLPGEVVFDLGYVPEGGKWRLATIAINIVPVKP